MEYTTCLLCGAPVASGPGAMEAHNRICTHYIRARPSAYRYGGRETRGGHSGYVAAKRPSARAPLVASLSASAIRGYYKSMLGGNGTPTLESAENHATRQYPEDRTSFSHYPASAPWVPYLWERFKYAVSIAPRSSPWYFHGVSGRGYYEQPPGEVMSLSTVVYTREGGGMFGVEIGYGFTPTPADMAVWPELRALEPFWVKDLASETVTKVSIEIFEKEDGRVRV